MAVLVPFLPAITAAVTAVSAVASYQQGKKSEKAQKEASEAQKRSAAVEAQRDRMRVIREARIRAAQVRAQAGAEGIGQTSSGVAGAISSIGSQAGSNIGAINVTQGFAETASNALQQSASAQVKQAGWQVVGQVAGSIFQQQGGYKSLFDMNKPSNNKK